MNDPGPIVVAVTGASGAIYAYRLVQWLLDAGEQVFLVSSATGRRIIREEMPDRADAETLFRFGGSRKPLVFSEKDFGAPFASGSFPFRGMVIVPASMGSVGAIASGVAMNVIHRGADVALKERRPLVIVPRETPLSSIHLENLLKLARAGAVVLPPSPGFYHRPTTIDEQVDFIVARILDQLRIPNSVAPRWKEEMLAAPAEETEE